MSNKSVDVATMLDDLNLPLAALRWKEIVKAPELADFTPYQLFREVLEPQYLETMNNRYKTNLRLSKLIDKSALTENLVTSNKRRYNDAVVQQLLSFHFAEERSMALRRRASPTSCLHFAMRPATATTAVCLWITVTCWMSCSS